MNYASTKLFKPLLWLFCLGLFVAQPGHSQNQAELNRLAADSFQKADHRLNEVFAELVKQGDKQANQRLREAQRAWLKFVDLHMQYFMPLEEGENPYFKYGSSYPMEMALEKTQLFKARIVQLEAFTEIPHTAELSQ